MGRWLNELDDDPFADAFGTVGVATAYGPQPHVAYQRDPIAWARDKLAIPEHTIRWSLNRGYDAHTWDGTPDPLVVAANALADYQNVGVESATTTGKSFWAAVLVLWFLACWEDARVFTFAPKEPQLRLFIWMEIGRLWPRFQAWFPTATLSTLSLRMRGGIDESWSAVGYAVGVGADEQSATKAQGMHAEHMLLVYEETPGIPRPVIIAGINTCTAPHNLRLAIGNPNHRLDTLREFCEGPRTVAVRISAFDHPNVVTNDPTLIVGAVSRQSIDDRRIKFGEESPVFQSRVRGHSPDQPVDALIRLDWLKAAAARYVARDAARAIPLVVTGKGVDVANSEHGDHAAECDFAENVCVRCVSFPCPDSNVLGSSIVTELRRPSSPTHGLIGARIGVDAIGVGAGTVNEMRRLGVIVQALYAGGNAMRMVERAEDGKLVEWSPDANLFENLRGQMYWQARVDLQNGTIDVPEDRELWEELTVMTYNDESKVVKVGKKDDVKKLIGRSPNKADAFVMANWVRKRSVAPARRELREGQSAGYDYAKRRVASKPSADEEIMEILRRGQTDRYALPNVAGDRYTLPYRRDR